MTNDEQPFCYHHPRLERLCFFSLSMKKPFVNHERKRLFD